MIRLRLLVVCLALCSASVTAATDHDAAGVAALRAQLETCVAQLPSSARLAFRESKTRRTTRIAPRLRRRWRTCLAGERDIADQEAIIALRNDMLALLSPSNTQDAARGEAEAIATRMVRETRRVSEQFDMVGSPLFNNFLVHIGAKQAGFCYQWTATLAKALNALPWQYFSRQWGVANLQKATENNALVITARDAPLHDGLVYDPWRGAGTPYWRSVAGDHYHWTTRYTERNVSQGVGLGDAQ